MIAKTRAKAIGTVNAAPDTKVEKFELGERVKTSAVNCPGIGQGVDGTGVIVGVQFIGQVPSGKVFYQVREKASNYVYNYGAAALGKLKTQKLFAYTDSTQEVHWATKNYTSTELTQFGFTRAEAYDKTIDLE